MNVSLAALWNGHRTIGRFKYLGVGAGLAVVKFAIDWALATQLFGQAWSPLHYVIWPNDGILRGLDLGDPQHTFPLALLAVSLPFIWVGVLLTLRRLRSAGLPAGLVLLFFVPLVNLLFFLVLVLLPPRTEPGPVPAGVKQDADTRFVSTERPPAAVPVERSHQPAAESAPAGEFISEQQYYRSLRPLRLAHQHWTGESYWRSGLVALLIAVPIAVGGVGVGTVVFHSYGFSLFIGGPFALGMISVLLFGFSRPQPLGPCLTIALLSAVWAGVAMLLVGFEGLICLILAAPLIMVVLLFGAAVGYVIQARPWLGDQTTALTLMMLVMLPGLMAAESANEPEPEVRAVRSEVIVAAAPETIWPLVIAFEPLPEPDEWIFRTGLAYPQRAEIQGSGVGAVRHCIFSTGAFVEPIEEWQPPSLLRFAVAEQPEPMREWSPYDIHPPHLHHYLVSQRGEFLLERLPDGRTRLQGTTWYSNRMWPASYWGLWSDYIIHRIHLRVLMHIQAQAESHACASDSGRKE